MSATPEGSARNALFQWTTARSSRGRCGGVSACPPLRVGEADGARLPEHQLGDGGVREQGGGGGAPSNFRTKKIWYVSRPSHACGRSSVGASARDSSSASRRAAASSAGVG